MPQWHQTVVPGILGEQTPDVQPRASRIIRFDLPVNEPAVQRFARDDRRRHRFGRHPQKFPRLLNVRFNLRLIAFGEPQQYRPGDRGLDNIGGVSFRHTLIICDTAPELYRSAGEFRPDFTDFRRAAAPVR